MFINEENLIFVYDAQISANLREIIESGNLTFSKKLRILGAVLDAMSYLSFHNILTRQICLDNIVLANNKPKLFDFSNAIHNENHKLQVTKIIPGFISAEILKEKNYNYKSDVFIFGVIMYCV